MIPRNRSEGRYNWEGEKPVRSFYAIRVTAGGWGMRLWDPWRKHNGMGSWPLLNYRLPRISTSLLPLLGLKVLRQKTKALARLRVKWATGNLGLDWNPWQTTRIWCRTPGACATEPVTQQLYISNTWHQMVALCPPPPHPHKHRQAQWKAPVRFPWLPISSSQLSFKVHRTKVLLSCN